MTLTKAMQLRATMSKRKAHNPVKRLIAQSKIAVADLALVMSLNDRQVDVRHCKTGKVVDVGPSLAQALDKTAFEWFVMLAVYCLESNGKQKLVTLPVQMKAAYKHSDLTKFLREQHQEMLDSAKVHNEVVNAAWFAIPVLPKPFNEDLAISLLLDKPEFWSKHEVIASAD